MIFHSHGILSALSLMGAIVAAAPSPAVELAKRSYTGAYMSYCSVNADPSSFWYEMDYYTNAVSGSQNGEQPDEAVPFGDVGSNITSPRGKRFTSEILSASPGIGQRAGSATDSDGGSYDCSAVDQRLLYTDPDGEYSCYTLYYCVPTA